MNDIYEFINESGYELAIEAVDPNTQHFGVTVCDNHICKHVYVPVSELDRLISALQKARKELK